MQLYQPGARNRKRMSSAGKGFDCLPGSPSPVTDYCYEVATLEAGLEKVFEKNKEAQWAVLGQIRINTDNTPVLLILKCLIYQLDR